MRHKAQGSKGLIVLIYAVDFANVYTYIYIYIYTHTYIYIKLDLI